jgi:PAS domain S-box-containing protein
VERAGDHEWRIARAVRTPASEGDPGDRRRQAELDALEKERRLRLVVDQTQAIIWTTDRELRYTSSFGAGLMAVGLRPQEAVGRTVFDFVPGNPGAVEVLAHRRALAKESSTFASMYAGRSFQAHVEPLRDEQGEIIGVIGVAVDISEQRRAEEMLRESESRYCLLFESNPSPMYVYDAETLAFLAVNEAAVRHYGFSREEFLSMKVTEIRPSEDVPGWLEYFGQRPDVYGGGVWRHRKKDGTEILAEITARAIDFGGRSARLVLVRDVKHRRRAGVVGPDREHLPRAHTLQDGIPNERGADRVRDPERSPRLRPRTASFCVRRPNHTQADMPTLQKPRILLSSL